jgi:hypothetical protein
MKTKNFFLVMLLSIFALSTLGGCDLFDNDDECSDSDMPEPYWFSVISNNIAYNITVNDPNVTTVIINATYSRYKCGTDTYKPYYDVTHSFRVKPPQTVKGMITGYECSTELRNYDDKVQLYVEISFTNLSGTVGTKIINLTKSAREMANRGEDYRWWPTFSTTF